MLSDFFHAGGSCIFLFAICPEDVTGFCEGTYSVFSTGVVVIYKVWIASTVLRVQHFMMSTFSHTKIISKRTHFWYLWIECFSYLRMSLSFLCLCAALLKDGAKRMTYRCHFDSLRLLWRTKCFEIWVYYDGFFQLIDYRFFCKQWIVVLKLSCLAITVTGKSCYGKS